MDVKGLELNNSWDSYKSGYGSSVTYGSVTVSVSVSTGDPFLSMPSHSHRSGKAGSSGGESNSTAATSSAGQYGTISTAPSFPQSVMNGLYTDFYSLTHDDGPSSRVDILMGIIALATDAMSGGSMKGVKAGGNALRRLVALDNNALIAAIEKGGASIVDATIGGRIPIVPRTAVREFLAGGGNKQALRQFLSDRGGRIATAGTEAGAASLRQQASSMGRSLGVNDSRIAASATKEGASVITNDRRFRKFLNAIGIGGEGF